MCDDWTLDTDVLISANYKDPTLKRELARQLLSCIASHSVLMWSKKVQAEYQARGAIKLIGNPPVAVQGQEQSYATNWLSSIQNLARVRPVRPQRLSGSEKESLWRAYFRDQADYPFLELARASHSKRLVAQENHYSDRAKTAITRIVGVVCLDFESALWECQQV